ncbi:MAG TPA: response regulator transcription factor [Chloroflexota bacterium]|nr:response regulator transcription factor [Chloroflexota bacterium]
MGGNVNAGAAGAPDILLVEDEPALRLVTRLACEGAGFRVREAATGADALRLTDERRPDLVLLDLMLPDMDGFDVCRALRRRDETLPVIMLTARADEVDKVVGLELGADDYLAKPVGTRELVARIRAHLRKAKLLAGVGGEAMLRAGALEIRTAAREVYAAGRSVTLTRTEFDILALLARHAGAALTRDQIVTGVWGYDAPETVGGDRLVDSHIKNLRAKLDGPWIVTVPRVGYKLVAQ